AEPMRVRSHFAVCSTFPTQLDLKNRAGRAIQDRNRPHAPEAPPIPTRPEATRTRRVVSELIATRPDLQRDVPGRRAARRIENDKNREPKPAESPLAVDRS